MFQVKFVRNPVDLKSQRDWLEKTLEGELPKIARQIDRGVKQYVLITNLPGTAHLDTGSIDKVQELLKSIVPVPSMVLWRDDLDRRLDNSWDLKWRYPQLLSNIDLLRALVQNQLTEDADRRATSIRAFLTDQCADDELLKFKQVDLQNKLLELFIDVPLSAPLSSTMRKRPNHPIYAYQIALQRARALTTIKNGHGGQAREFGEIAEGQSLGAAALLFDPDVQLLIPNIVIEGAPGQGKSTVTQYVAQIHRLRLLGRSNEPSVIAAISHLDALPLRLPIRVDLRDLATWLTRKDPFNPERDDGPEAWHKSSESFLCALIRHHSGGARFDVADLHAVLKITPIALLFDGLDEVADMQRRHEVVEEIARTVRRLTEICPSVQTVVTSRPASFANAPNFPEPLFAYLQLSHLTPSLIEQYAEQWLSARHLQGRERTEIRKTLATKLNQPHLRDLSRNTMQLTILLSLVLTRGSSLPDKRTALYDSYIELFLNRESEKSSVVRDHREIVVDVHRYLAWVLHSDAQLADSNGSIREEKLEEVVCVYLTQEGHDPTLAKTLFHGTVERVGALVSRVEGTFEFEVQPLREYFAARYLYETAPYSPTGNEKKGTRTDRFDALSRDFHWLNVARFYAGCFSKGELPALVDRLSELTKDPIYSKIAHPRLLGAMFLGDWVFSQHVGSMREVVSLVIDDIGLRFLASSRRRNPSTQATLSLPSKAGREELLDYAFNKLRTESHRDYADDLIEVINSNSSNTERFSRWLDQVQTANPADRFRWISHALSLGVIGQLTSINFSEFEDVSAKLPFVQALIDGRRWDLLEENEENFSTAIEGVLDSYLEPPHREWRNSGSALERLLLSLNPARYNSSFLFPEPNPLRDVLRRHQIAWAPPQQKSEELKYKKGANYSALLRICDEVLDVPASRWTRELSPWHTVVETVREVFGERWIAWQLAISAAGIKSSSETARDAPELFDSSAPLVRRTRYARLRSGNAAWWERHFRSAETVEQKLAVSLLCVKWTTSTTLEALVDCLNTALSSLNLSDWERFARALRLARIADGNAATSDTATALISLPLGLSERCIYALSFRLNHLAQSRLFDKHLSSYAGSDKTIQSFCQSVAFSRLFRNSKEHAIDETLLILKRNYSSGTVSDALRHVGFGRRTSSIFTLEASKTVLEEPASYPSFVVALAEGMLRGQVAADVTPVGKRAVQEEWTFR